MEVNVPELEGAKPFESGSFMCSFRSAEHNKWEVSCKRPYEIWMCANSDPDSVVKKYAVDQQHVAVCHKKASGCTYKSENGFDYLILHPGFPNGGESFADIHAPWGNCMADVPSDGAIILVCAAGALDADLDNDLARVEEAFGDGEEISVILSTNEGEFCETFLDTADILREVKRAGYAGKILKAGEQIFSGSFVDNDICEGAHLSVVRSGGPPTKFAFTDLRFSESSGAFASFGSVKLEGEPTRIVIDYAWKDQGWGNRKGRMQLSVVDGLLESRIGADMFGIAEHAMTQGQLVLDESNASQFLAHCNEGTMLELQRSVGGGGGHRLEIGNFTGQVEY